MPIKTTATLKESPWGRYISLAEAGFPQTEIRDEAFLDYPGNHSDFKLGEKYSIDLFFRIWYTKTDEQCETKTEERGYLCITADSIEKIVAHPDFKKCKLIKEEKIMGWFRITK